MVNPPDNQTPQKAVGLAGYATRRVAATAALIILVIWAISSIPESSGQDKKQTRNKAAIEAGQDLKDHGETTHLAAQAAKTDHLNDTTHSNTDSHGPASDASVESATHTDTPHDTGAPIERAPHAAEETSDHGATDDSHQPAAPPSEGSKADDGTTPAPHDSSTETDHHGEETAHDAAADKAHDDLPAGVSFVEATIKSLDDQLNHRFWGWRPNDIVNLTDNVNNFQLGVLEVTRRTVVLLAERISRTGTTDAFNPHLQNSMNWLMVKASRYWFPAPEAKYKESIKELEAYKENLINGSGSFYTRTDNLIPLLSSYEDLLGSCDENLVKQKNQDGKDVSMFKADDYFYYAQGVASALASLLEAVHHDFLKTLESRHAAELLHHALESCRQAAALDPIFITNGDLDGIFANHRANMAAPISHARFYIGQLIKTLST